MSSRTGLGEISSRTNAIYYQYPGNSSSTSEELSSESNVNFFLIEGNSVFVYFWTWSNDPIGCFYENIQTAGFSLAQ